MLLKGVEVFTSLINDGRYVNCCLTVSGASHASPELVSLKFVYNFYLKMSSDLIVKHKTSSITPRHKTTHQIIFIVFFL